MYIVIILIKTKQTMKNVEFKKSKNYLLIKEIWEYAKHTHNDKDFEDLMTFDENELKEILIDYKNIGV